VEDSVGTPKKLRWSGIKMFQIVFKHSCFVFLAFYAIFSKSFRNYQISISSWQVATLPGTEASSVFDFSDDEVVPDLLDNDRDESVVDEDPFAGS
jgi:hypothetical protein